MTHRRRTIGLLASAVIGTVAPCAAAEAATVAVEAAPTAVEVEGSTVAWSSFDSSVGRYFVAVRRDGSVSRLPIAGRTVPFDLDLGVDKRGRTMLAYSRCRSEPPLPRGSGRLDWLAGRGCRLYAFDLDRGQELPLQVGGVSGGASVAVPAVWGDRVAYGYARTPESEVRLYVADRRSGNGRRRIPAARGSGTRPTVTSIDLGTRHLAYVWSNLITDRAGCEPPPRTGDVYAEDAWLVHLRRSARRKARRVARACETGEIQGLDSIAVTSTELRLRALRGAGTVVATARLADSTLRLTSSPPLADRNVSYARSETTEAVVTTRGPGESGQLEYPIEVFDAAQ